MCEVDVAAAFCLAVAAPDSFGLEVDVYDFSAGRAFRNSMNLTEYTSTESQRGLSALHKYVLLTAKNTLPKTLSEAYKILLSV